MDGIRSFVRVFTCPWFWGSLFQGSLVRRFICLGVHLSILYVYYNFRVRVRHSQGAPLDSISNISTPYPFSQIPTRIALHVNGNNSCASMEAGSMKIIF